MDDTEFNCLVPFTDESESFVNGFEAGMIWQRMTEGQSPIGGDREPPMHSDNLEVFKRMAKVMDYRIDDFLDLRDGWMQLYFFKSPRKFSVIQGGITNEGNS